MQRVANEWTADKVERDGGWKWGDFGTGGRVYKHYSVGGGGGYSSGYSSGGYSSGYSSSYRTSWGGSDSENASGCCLFAIFLTLLSLFGVYYTETSRSLDLSTATAAQGAVIAPLPPSSSNDGRLVFVSAPNVSLIGAPAKDPFFERTFPPLFAYVHRVTEYCQWAEVRHSNTKEIGRTPTYRCGDNSEKICGGNPIYETTISYVSLRAPARTCQPRP